MHIVQYSNNFNKQEIWPNTISVSGSYNANVCYMHIGIYIFVYFGNGWTLMVDFVRLFANKLERIYMGCENRAIDDNILWHVIT